MSIRWFKRAMAAQQIESDLVFIRTNFASIISATVKLETQGLPLIDSIDCFESVHQSLGYMRRTEFVEKMNAVLRRNKGNKCLKEINKVLHEGVQSSDEYVKKLSSNEVAMSSDICRRGEIILRV